MSRRISTRAANSGSSSAQQATECRREKNGQNDVGSGYGKPHAQHERSKAYQDDLATLTKSGKSTKEVFEALAVADIQAATGVVCLVVHE